MTIFSGGRRMSWRAGRERRRRRSRGRMRGSRRLPGMRGSRRQRTMSWISRRFCGGSSRTSATPCRQGCSGTSPVWPMKLARAYGRAFFAGVAGHGHGARRANHRCDSAKRRDGMGRRIIRPGIGVADACGRDERACNDHGCATPAQDAGGDDVASAGSAWHGGAQRAEGAGTGLWSCEVAHVAVRGALRPGGAGAGAGAAGTGSVLRGAVYGEQLYG